MQYGSEDVKCPFYKDETRNSIRCEGVVSISCINNFNNSLQKQEHKAEYCCLDFNSCPLNKAIMIKY